MRLTLTTKIILLLQVALCFALISTAALSYLKMERMVEDTVASRFTVALRGLAGEVEGAVSLGVSLNALRNLDALIQRALSRDDRITGLVLFNDAGEILASAGRNAPIGTMPADWKAAFARDGRSERGAKVTSGDSQALLLGIRNAFGGVAGGIGLTYSLNEVHAGIRGTIPELALSSGINLVTGLLITMVAVWLLLRPIQRLLRELTAAVNALGHGEPPEITPEMADFAPDLPQFADRILHLQQQETDGAAHRPAHSPAESVR
ncbi:hypothetical protein [Azospirillum rugosum]|uniref:HAMP domain-containing protein n=1 Tax=Azospirillum rugosum TaxID=416170 RepID=A0ABS4SCM2_9PROT|nr:hypothetical protein [Azospirillum rugosum]MBP2290312.1 hypothetical protein [Azospirillum rugosum]MDQ0527788.1 hypothetical protein [Azospirillum rugosum]